MKKRKRKAGQDRSVVLICIPGQKDDASNSSWFWFDRTTWKTVRPATRDEIRHVAENWTREDLLSQ